MGCMHTILSISFYKLNHTHKKIFCFEANSMILCQHQFNIFKKILLQKSKFFSWCAQKNQLCLYLHAKRYKMSVCPEIVAINAKKKKIHKHLKHSNTHQSLFCNKIGIKIK